MLGVLFRRPFAAAVALLLLLTTSSFAQDRGHPPPTFTILHFNDVYEITPVEAGKAGGLARVARLPAGLKAKDPTPLPTLGGHYLSPPPLGTPPVDGPGLGGRPM